MPGERVDVAVTRSLGLVRAKSSIVMPLDTSDRIADQSGADVSSESLPSLGELSELPIQTPATRAGAFGSSGGARKPYGEHVAVSWVVPVL